MKRGGFDERVANCMARFHDVEKRSNAERDWNEARKFREKSTASKPAEPHRQSLR